MKPKNRNGTKVGMDAGRPVLHGPVTLRPSGKPGSRTGWYWGLPAYWWRSVAFHAGVYLLTPRVEEGDDSHLVYSAFPGEESDLKPTDLYGRLSSSEKEMRMWTPWSSDFIAFLRDRWDYNEEEAKASQPIPSYGVVYPMPNVTSPLGQLCAGHIILTSPAAGVRLIAEALRHA
jgi:hypothetical protein